MIGHRVRRNTPQLQHTDRSVAGVVEHHWRFTHYPRLTVIQRIAGGGVTTRHLVDGIECVSAEAARARLSETRRG